MAIPVKKVEIEVDPNAGIQPFFTLDDPVLGILDDPAGESILGSLAYVDVTDWVSLISVNRGASRELDRFDTGTAQVTFDNTTRQFDPLGTSPFSQQLLPHRGIRVYSGGTPVFFGIVEDWNLSYNPNGDNASIAVASDEMSFLASRELTAFTATPELTGQRINAILDRPEIAWPVEDRNIDTGTVQLGNDEIAENTVSLDYINLVAQSSLGSLFMSKDGKITFQDNNTGPSSNGLIEFTDDGLGIPFTELQVQYGAEFLYNRVSLTRVNGTAQIAEDTASQAFYGITTYSQEGLLMADDDEALLQAQRLLARYSNPEYRFQSLTVDLSELTPAQQTNLLNLELTDIVKIKFTPNNIGDPIEKFARIIGINNNIGNFVHTTTFNFETLDFAPFTLNDGVFGILSGEISAQIYNEIGLTYDGAKTYNGDVTTIEGYGLG